MSTETYALADFTTSGGSVTGALQAEIIADPAITVQILGVTVGADVRIDFAAALDAGMKTALDALVAAHAAPASPDDPAEVRISGDAAQRADGILRVQLEPSTKSSKIRVQGFKLTPDLKAAAEDDPKETYADMVFNAADEVTGIDFQGIVGIWAKDHLQDDYMELLAMFPKTGTEAQWTALGLGPWPFGAAPTPEDAGQEDVELSRFGATVYLPPDGKIPPIIGEGTFTIADPIFLRFCYFATGVDGVATVPFVTGMVRYWYGLA